jgi:cell wall-associated NlpC family hydrolase
MLRDTDQVELAILWHASWALLGKPYIWAGDDPIAGFDCSGLMIELLASIGEAPPGDKNAQGLYDYYAPTGRRDIMELGSLAFFGSGLSSIVHVAMLLDRRYVIHAGGGGSRTRTEEDAITQNAYVCVRPLSRIPRLVAIVRPCYKFENA